MKTISNAEVANLLEHLAGNLPEEGRARAWRNASRTIRQLGRSVAEMLRTGGIEALAALPDVGAGLAFVISAAIETADDRVAMAN